jgi:acetyl esterase
MPMDDDVRDMLESMAASGRYPTIGDPRDVRTRFQGLPVPAIEGIWRIEDVDVDNGEGGRLRLRVYSPDDEPDAPAVLAFHGGGWVLGDLLFMESNCRALAKRVGCRVVSVEYRLAPEHRFPAAINDAYRALTWVADHAERLGVDPARIGAYGQSAGGNLVACLAVMARDRGGPGLSFQVPIYPVVDADFDRPSYQEWANGPGLKRAQMQWYWDAYVAEAERRNPYVAPLHAESLAGLAPALVVTAEAEPLRSEGEAYAARLHDDGVDVRLITGPGLHHGFMNVMHLFPKAQLVFDEVVAEMRARFARVGSDAL